MHKSKTGWLFLLCCVIPLVMAYVLVKLDWNPTQTTNQGQFLNATTYIDNWEQHEGVLWSIALSAPQACEHKCAQQVERLSKLYQALGKKQKHVELVVLGNTQKSQHLIKYPEHTSLSAGSVYLIDHRGLVVLEYPFIEDDEKSRVVHKGLMKDLKKLLNYARSS